MDTKKNNTGVWVVVAVIVVIIVVLIARSYKRGAATPIDQGAVTTVDDQNATAGVTATEDVSKGSVTTAAPISYAKALVDYKDRRVQFGVMCETTPSASTFKNGTVIMLDNRAGEARTFHLGSMGDIAIKAWGFKLIKLSVAATPNALAIDCGSHQNAAIITVQK